MLPDRCSIKAMNGDCPNPPSYLVSIVMENAGEYMVGVVCDEHEKSMEKRLTEMQAGGDLVKGSIRFVSLKSVGTDCIFAEDEKK